MQTRVKHWPVEIEELGEDCLPCRGVGRSFLVHCIQHYAVKAEFIRNSVSMLYAKRDLKKEKLQEFRRRNGGQSG